MEGQIKHGPSVVMSKISGGTDTTNTPEAQTNLAVLCNKVHEYLAAIRLATTSADRVSDRLYGKVDQEDASESIAAACRGEMGTLQEAVAVMDGSLNELFSSIDRLVDGL